MRGGPGGTVFDPVQPERHDPEVTLGPFTLTLIGGVLFTLCGLCFVFGYAVGHRNAESSSAISVPPPATPSFTPQSGASGKPSAGLGEGQPGSTAAPADMSEPAIASTGATITTASGGTMQSGSGPDQVSSAPTVRTVVATQPVGQAATSGGVQAALAQSAGVMVQIAAVSHSEDADVLVGALRKRGYAVTARRDPSDGLLHVQIGPFANRDEAYAMRQKLLNDGYNAIVQP